MSRVWFTSDLHLGHDLVARTRGFSWALEHDAAIVDRWVESVGRKDQVWILGDIATSRLGHAMQILQHLPGEKHLIAGNHDAVHPMNRNAHKQLKRYLSVFESVASAARRKIGGRDVVLSHFPYLRDRDEPRYLQWRLRDEGLPLLHGHTHGDERASYRADGAPEIHVGLDAWDLRPVPLETITNLLKEDS